MRKKVFVYLLVTTLFFVLLIGVSFNYISCSMDSFNKISLYAIIGLLASLFFTLLLIFLFNNGIINPIYKLSEYAKGNVSETDILDLPEELKSLAVTFDKIKTDLQESVAEANNKMLYLRNTINSLQSGFIAIDEDKNVTLINDKAKDIFRLCEKKVDGESLLALTHNLKIYENIDFLDVVAYELVIDNSTYRVTSCPILEEDKSVHGNIVILNDVTTIRELENMRSNFVSNVTHELKTPLTSIRGFIDTLKNGAVKDEKTAMKFLDIIDIEALRLEKLISDVLELGRIESIKEDVDKAPFLISEVGEIVMRLLEKVASEKNVKIEYKETEPIIVYASKYRIQQILLNLVDNAIMYNKQGGYIYIQVSKNANDFLLSIRDTGIGIDQDEINNVFQRFYKSQRTLGLNSKSTGLGLSIVKHIVELYGGKISINSIIDKGTEFIINMPIIKIDK